MSAQFITVDGNTTIQISFTATTTKIQSVVGDAAEYLHKEVTDSEGVVTNPFSGLTNQEKLDIVATHLKQVIIDQANTFRSNRDQKLAREEAEATKHTL